jgi:serine/threonine-protein kinase
MTDPPRSEYDDRVMADDVFGIVGTTQAGVFRVDRVVAEGGFAVVYRALHQGFRAPVALKCLKVPDAMTEEQKSAFLEKFRSEGELLFRLSAVVPAVVRPLHVDVLVIDGRMVPFLALEWLDGEGLDAIVQRRRAQGKPPLDIERVVSFLQPAAAALAEAHRLPGPDGPIAVIHSDLKPENIYVAKSQGGEVVKILDFGIARTKSAAALDAGQVTSGSALEAFTPGYAAPEQWQPKRFGQVGPWTDVYGLALTMVEMLTGKPAIDGDLTAMMGTALDMDRRPTPRAEGAKVSDAVEQAFQRALAVDPRERTRSIEDFWTQLELAIGARPSLKGAQKTADRRSISMESERPPPLEAPPPERALAATALAPTANAPPPPYQRPVITPQVPRAAPVIARQVRAASFVLAARPRERGTLARESPSGEHTAELREALRVPLGIVAVAAAVGLGDWLYGRFTGELIQVAGLRPVWIAGPLALIGVALAAWKIMSAL